MKAVVVELNNTKAAVLSDDGCITTIKNNNYEIGQVIQLNQQPKVSMIKKISVCAASAAAVIFISAGTWAYASPYSYVSVDVNPSIEFTVNRFDRVIKVRAVNDDGEEILKEISLDDLTNQTIENAITTTVKEISEAGYFDGETEGGIVIATSSEDMEKAEELAQELKDSVEEETSNNGDVVIVESISVGMERVEEAKALGVTPGKLNLVEKLQEAADDPSSISLEEWLGKPVKDIMKATKDYKKADTNQEDMEAEASEDNLDNGIDENDSSTVQNDNETTDNQINEDKALSKAEKDAEKAIKEAAKAEEKAKAAKEKADKKAKEASKSDETVANNTANDTAGQSPTKAAEAKSATEEATKAAEKAKKEAEKAQKEAEKAGKEAEKAQKEDKKNKDPNNDSKKNEKNTIDDVDNSKEPSSENIIDQNSGKEDTNQDQSNLDSTEAPNKESGYSGNSDMGNQYDNDNINTGSSDKNTDTDTQAGSGNDASPGKGKN